jgi:hypothetical protein
MAVPQRVLRLPESSFGISKIAKIYSRHLLMQSLMVEMENGVDANFFFRKQWLQIRGTAGKALH